MSGIAALVAAEISWGASVFGGPAKSKASPMLLAFSIRFRLRNLEVKAFALYGLPNEQIDHVVKTILFVSEICGLIIPMLFAPVPSTEIFQKWLPWFKERGWHNRLERLNGKLYPFIETSEGSLSDYIDLQRLMFTLNQHFRSKSFQVFGESRVSQAFLYNLRNGFEDFVRIHKKGPLAEPEIRDTPSQLMSLPFVSSH